MEGFFGLNLNILFAFPALLFPSREDIFEEIDCYVLNGLLKKNE